MTWAFVLKIVRIQNRWTLARHHRIGCVRSFVISSSIRTNENVKLNFNLPDGTKFCTEGKVGDTILDVVINKNVPIDGYGACEGTLACSTCHIILKPEDYARIPNKPCDEELDMLDLAHGLTDTSRLGCQINLTKELDGLEINVPAGLADARNV